MQLDRLQEGEYIVPRELIVYAFSPAETVGDLFWEFSLQRRASFMVEVFACSFGTGEYYVRLPKFFREMVYVDRQGNAPERLMLARDFYRKLSYWGENMFFNDTRELVAFGFPASFWFFVEKTNWKGIKSTNKSMALKRDLKLVDLGDVFTKNPKNIYTTKSES